MNLPSRSFQIDLTALYSLPQSFFFKVLKKKIKGGGKHFKLISTHAILGAPRKRSTLFYSD